MAIIQAKKETHIHDKVRQIATRQQIRVASALTMTTMTNYIQLSCHRFGSNIYSESAPQIAAMGSRATGACSTLAEAKNGNLVPLSAYARLHIPKDNSLRAILVLMLTNMQSMILQADSPRVAFCSRSACHTARTFAFCKGYQIHQLSLARIYSCTSFFYSCLTYPTYGVHGWEQLIRFPHREI